MIFPIVSWSQTKVVYNYRILLIYPSKNILCHCIWFNSSLFFHLCFNLNERCLHASKGDLGKRWNIMRRKTIRFRSVGTVFGSEIFHQQCQNPIKSLLSYKHFMNRQHYQGENLKPKKQPRQISMKDCQDTRYEDFHLSTSIWIKTKNLIHHWVELKMDFPFRYFYFLFFWKQLKFVQEQQNEKKNILNFKK